MFETFSATQLQTWLPVLSVDVISEIGLKHNEGTLLNQKEWYFQNSQGMARPMEA